MKPAALANTLLDKDKLWCKVCHQVVEKRYWESHKQKRQHTSAINNLNRMKKLSLDMWEAHRGAPVNESNVESEEYIGREFEEFKKSQRLREMQQSRSR
jgi:hypothetical protein